jgi:hypothetical protein
LRSICGTATNNPLTAPAAAGNTELPGYRKSLKKLINIAAPTNGLPCSRHVLGDIGVKKSLSAVTAVTFVFPAPPCQFSKDLLVWGGTTATNRRDGPKPAAAFGRKVRAKETSWVFSISPVPPTAR